MERRHALERAWEQTEIPARQGDAKDGQGYRMMVEARMQEVGSGDRG